jgi:alanine racemase
MMAAADRHIEAGGGAPLMSTAEDRALPERAHASGPPPAEAGGILTIDLTAITDNWRTLGREAMPVECAAVVKGDGYGCGIEPVATALANAGCRTFFVADLSEARRVRAAAPEAIIYVLNGLFPETPAAFAQAYAQPVINSLAELAEWDTFVRAQNWPGGAALHVDTGMNRLGLSPGEAAAVATRVQSGQHGITLLMSHLACAEEPDHPLTDTQIRLFREMRILFRGIPASIANSSGIFLGSSAHCDLVRPGAALFGVNPTPGKPNPMRPVVDLKARIAQIRVVGKGETVGYNATWTAKRQSRIAVVAVGYADGYPRNAGSGDRAAEMIVAGQRCPIAGRVSMDLIAVDISRLPDNAVRRGEFVTLIGDGLTVDDVGASAATIGYEILTRLGQRYRRVYRGSAPEAIALPALPKLDRREQD